MTALYLFEVHMWRKYYYNYFKKPFSIKFSTVLITIFNTLAKFHAIPTKNLKNFACFIFAPFARVNSRRDENEGIGQTGGEWIQHEKEICFERSKSKNVLFYSELVPIYNLPVIPNSSSYTRQSRSGISKKQLHKNPYFSAHVG